MQLTHDENKFKRTTFPLTIVCDQVTAPANVGSVFRAADAFGVAHIVFAGPLVPDFGKRMQKTSRSTEKYISYEFSEAIDDCLTQLKSEGYTLVALEITSDSIPLQQLQIPNDAKIALILGAERHGISEKALQMADVVTHIPMYGNNSSMNVAQALTIALYEITNHFS